MKITRLGNERDFEKDVERIEITLAGKDYIISERFGALDIMACHDSINVKPAYANVIQVEAQDRGDE